MLNAVLVLAIALAAVGLAFWALRLPWPQRLRWLLATAATDITGMTSACDPFGMREVLVVRVLSDGSWTTAFLYGPRGTGHPLALRVAATLPERARLERWEVARTPLLLVFGRDGEASLHGPHHAVSGLWLERARGEQASFRAS